MNLFNSKNKKLALLLVAVLGAVFVGAFISKNAQEDEKPQSVVEQNQDTSDKDDNPSDTEQPDKPDDLSDKTDNQPKPDEPTASKPEDLSEPLDSTPKPDSWSSSFSLSDIPAYTGSPFIAVNNNQPYFTDDEMTDSSFESYAPLDSLNRCGVCLASIGKDIMPTEDRGNISSVIPTAWKNQRYDIVDGGWVYNRCHLLGFQLTGENANNKNLVTGTRYMNVEGMLPFENMVADYIKETGNNVYMRVTPIFDGNNLLASGVLMEAKSVEDDGDGVCYAVYCYNVQPGIELDYADGSNFLSGEQPPKTPTTQAPSVEPAPQTPAIETPAAPTDSSTSDNASYILNTNSHKFHYPGCSSAEDISAENYGESTASRDELIAQGYEPCGRCRP